MYTALSIRKPNAENKDYTITCSACEMGLYHTDRESMKAFRREHRDCKG